MTTKLDVIRTPKVENVRMLEKFAKASSTGTLYLTATHLIFVDPDNKKETWILHPHVSSIEKLPLTTYGSPVHIRCKSFLSVRFVIPRERDCVDVFNAVLRLSQPADIRDLYCFHYSSPSKELSQGVGWNFFDLQAEFQRLGVPNDSWCLTTINKDYELCDTYPRVLCVPTSASTPVLVGSSKFRSRGRLPVLSYLHKNKAALCRCSQPLAGFSARCVEDETMLCNVLKANPNAGFMYVVDTRPKINAMANRAAGKGYENKNFYENIQFLFLPIENIHVVRNSLSKLNDACELKNPSMSSFLSGLESSAWLKHIKAILETSHFVAQALASEGVSVLVHCSDGWDRTAQVCSVAQLLIDPHYRTIQGFQALIEKEWLAFGHKFMDRCGLFGAGANTSPGQETANEGREISPIFTQFLECVWQLMMQFPTSFQFNERFLLCLHDHAHAPQFGTFVGNCEKDRVDLRLSEKTYSLWGYVATHMDDFINPIYAVEDSKLHVLQPTLSPQGLMFWRGMYMRFENGIHPRDNWQDIAASVHQHCVSLEDHIKLLQKRIAALKSKPATPMANGIEKDRKWRLSMEEMREELESVALDWKSFRNLPECPCSTPFDQNSMRYHCWSCGEVFCTRCINKHVALPGLSSQRAVPVCRPCYRKLRPSATSAETP
ncbi:unnamed protein product [Notodromas monacha]|uniref:phosphatidylinositol-3,5-bisphosphate 3-phosphatase n=2 Tax=Notodromas monacha TaxID=399045 RepID=A0A7R9BPY0_9CRUS|nr:unnamed protein product [Notodromas monacha]CAG0918631.1 unnamed protein product [Notodromas monacha]